MPKSKTSIAPSTASAFKKRIGGLLTLPSGEVVKVRNPGGLQAFLSKGLIPNSLMGMVESSISGGEALDVNNLIAPKGVLDQSVISDMMSLTDQVVMATMVEPKVYPTPEEESDRDDEILYVDEISDEDKMFIFQWTTGGTKDVEQFRKELATTMDDMASIPGLANPAE